MAVQIKKSRQVDAQTMAELCLFSWEGLEQGSSAYEDVKRQLTKQMQQMLQRQSRLRTAEYSAIAYREEEPCGLILFGKSKEEGKHAWGEILHIYVPECHARQGIGTALLTHALCTLQGKRIHPVMVWLATGNEAGHNFLQKFGFQPDIRRKDPETQITEIRYCLERSDPDSVGPRGFY